MPSPLGGQGDQRHRSRHTGERYGAQLLCSASGRRAHLGLPPALSVHRIEASAQAAVDHAADRATRETTHTMPHGGDDAEQRGGKELCRCFRLRQLERRRPLGMNAKPQDVARVEARCQRDQAVARPCRSHRGADAARGGVSDEDCRAGEAAQCRRHGASGRWPSLDERLHQRDDHRGQGDQEPCPARCGQPKAHRVQGGSHEYPQPKLRADGDFRDLTVLGKAASGANAPRFQLSNTSR